MPKMTSLTVSGVTYEIVDADAREKIETIETDVIVGLDERLCMLETPEITITKLSVTPSTVDANDTVTKVVITANCSAAPIEAAAIVNNTNYSMVIADQTASLVVNDNFDSGGKTSATVAVLVTVTDKYERTASYSSNLNFYAPIFYGVGETWPDSPNKMIQGNRKCSFTLTAGDDEYIWYACPVDYGTPTLYVGGFAGGFSEIDTVTIGAFDYYRYRSDHVNLGETTVEVK